MNFPPINLDQADRQTLQQTPLALAMMPPTAELPLFLHRVPAGFPSPATDYLDDGLDLNAYLVRHKAASFFFTVAGDSMTGAGILSGDKVLVDRAIEAQHGHIVVAVVDREFTLKRLYVTGYSAERLSRRAV